jgi:hypothetical protein
MPTEKIITQTIVQPKNPGLDQIKLFWHEKDSTFNAIREYSPYDTRRLG